MLKSFKDVDFFTHGATYSIMKYPYTKKNFFYKSPGCTEAYTNPYSQRSLYHTYVYQHAWWRQYSDNGVRGHE